VRDFEALRKLLHLQELLAEGNPALESASARPYIFYLLRRLNRLDADEVTPDQRGAADRQFRDSDVWPLNI
jgi:hypothetical protein